MKVIYIAGPFRAPTGWKVEQNVRRAEECGFRVAQLGGMPLIPHTNTRFFNGELTDQFWLDGTLELLKRCDAVMLVDGWTSSTGARGEFDYAQANGIPCFVSYTELEEWLSESGQTA